MRTLARLIVLWDFKHWKYHGILMGCLWIFDGSFLRDVLDVYGTFVVSLSDFSMGFYGIYPSTSWGLFMGFFDVLVKKNTS